MPKPVEVIVLVAPPVVTVVVTTEVAVVEAVQPVQVVHGASEAQEFEVQPDHVLAGHPLVPHQLVHGPEVHAPELCEAQGPHPSFPPLPPKGPTPPAPDHPFSLLLLPAPPAHAPGPNPEGAPVVMVCQLLATLLNAEGSGCAEVMLDHSEVAVGQAVREAAEVQEE